jgi:hypothetical protein
LVPSARGFVTTPPTGAPLTIVVSLSSTADAMSGEERQIPCLVENAGKKLTTGKQAECYANNFIGLHLKSMANGPTYADLGRPQSQLREQVAQAKESNAPNLAALEEQLADVSQQRDTVVKGETLRGLLLASYGFSEFGVSATTLSSDSARRRSRIPRPRDPGASRRRRRRPALDNRTSTCHRRASLSMGRRS